MNPIMGEGFFKSEYEFLKHNDYLLLSDCGELTLGVNGTHLFRAFQRVVELQLQSEGYQEVVFPTVYPASRFHAFHADPRTFVELCSPGMILVPFCEPVFLDYIRFMPTSDSRRFSWCTTYTRTEQGMHTYENIHCEFFRLIDSTEQDETFCQMKHILLRILSILGEKSSGIFCKDENGEFCQSLRSSKISINDADGNNRMIAVIHLFALKDIDPSEDEKYLVSACCSMKLLMTVLRKHIKEKNVHQWTAQLISQSTLSTSK